MELLDTAQVLKFAFALLFVLSLMGLLALAMRRINNGGTIMPASRRRLKVVETLPLDPRRKLAIVRCDNKEHLLILGTNSETVIESGLQPPQDEARIIEIDKIEKSA
ncbi:MAG: FliO/MopB family protein [Micavibrio sp.]